MTRCFLHIGTHKTGTCALQAVFAGEAHAIEARFAYPRAGRILNGQHNVAWELNDDTRFDPARGTLAGLVAEVAVETARPSVVSSEDFEYLHARPQALTGLAGALRAADVQTTAIVYLRNRLSYAESLYAELTRHGPMESFASYLETVLRDGAYAFADRWVFAFEYARLVAPFAAAFGRDAVIVRPYREGRPDGELIADFFDACGLAPGPPPTATRANPRADLDEVIARLRAYHTVGRGAQLPALDEVPPGLPFAVLDGADVGRISARFAADDRALEQAYGVRLDDIAPRPQAAGAQRAILDDVARRWELA